MHDECTIYYQNVRGLRTKDAEFLSEAMSSTYSIICLTETWLVDGISSSNYFPPKYEVYRRDRDYVKTGKSLGGGVLIAADRSLKVHRRSDLECYPESVWIEVMSTDGRNFLIGNYYFPPMFDHTIFCEHINFLEERIDFSKFRVHMYGDFNLPGYDWESGSFLVSHANTRLKLLCLLDFVHFNGFEQRNTVRNCCGNILDLALVTSVVDISLAKAPLSRVDNYHQPFIVSFSSHLPSAFSIHNHGFPTPTVITIPCISIFGTVTGVVF